MYNKDTIKELTRLNKNEKWESFWYSVRPQVFGGGWTIYFITMDFTVIRKIKNMLLLTTTPSPPDMIGICYKSELFDDAIFTFEQESR